MRKETLFILTAVVLILALSGWVSAADTTDHTIQVSGSGTVTGTPDRVQISFSVQTQNSDVKTAQADNAVAMNNVLGALAAAGVSRDQIKTTGYTITPVYAQNNNGILSGNVETYQVTNTLLVTLNDTSTAGTMIDTAVTAGANQVNSIQFMLSDAQASSLRSQALAKAVTNARADADTVTGALNESITGIQTVDVSQGITPVVYGNYDATSSASGKLAVPTPIQSGDITVTAQVTVTYLIS